MNTDQIQRDQLTQLTSISGLLGRCTLDNSVPKFNGDSKKFRPWVKSVEKFIQITGAPVNNAVGVAYQAAEGLVSDFINRYIDQQGGTVEWSELKKELTAYFGEITDPQQALLMLRKLKQKRDEGVQIYAERLMTLAEDAWPDQLTETLVQQQLVNVYIDGLYADDIARRLLRQNPKTIEEAVKLAATEQNLRSRFDLRHRASTGSMSRFERKEEPMEINKFTGKCFNCNKYGHKAVQCRRSSVKRVNAIEGPRCWACNEVGHMRNECPRLTQIRSGKCGKCGRVGHISATCRLN